MVSEIFNGYQDTDGCPDSLTDDIDGDGDDGNDFDDIGTDIGVFALPEGLTTWQPLAAGLPNTVVHDLVYDGKRGRLIAATHGRGMFTLAVAGSALRGNVTATGTLSWAPLDRQCENGHTLDVTAVQ